MNQIDEFRPANILLVEDNPADQKLTLRAFNKGKIKTNIFIAEDGQDAMEFLLKEGKYSTDTNPNPDLILLDINMPRMDGKQVLKEIRQNRELQMIPVIMLTTSDQDRDVMESYKLGVNAYINKPVRINEFMDVISKLEEFWFRLTILPSLKR